MASAARFGDNLAVGCLDDQAVLDMIEGRMSPGARRAAVEHADGCVACRELIAGAAAALMPAPP